MVLHKHHLLKRFAALEGSKHVLEKRAQGLGLDGIWLQEVVYPTAFLDGGGDTFVSGGLSGKFTDRPTISYAPTTGENFVRSLMAPVPLEALMSVIQGGVPADFTLGLTMQSTAGHYNHGMYAGRFQEADAEFATLLQLIRALRQARAMDTDSLILGLCLVWVAMPGRSPVL